MIPNGRLIAFPRSARFDLLCRYERASVRLFGKRCLDLLWYNTLLSTLYTYTTTLVHTMVGYAEGG